jgi:hypothetical protein
MKDTAVEAEKMAEPARHGFTAHCPHCRQEAVFSHARIATRRHLLLTLVTGGLWAVVWVSLLVGKALRPWRCCVCGWHKAEFRSGPREGMAFESGRQASTPEKVQPPTVE